VLIARRNMALAPHTRRTAPRTPARIQHTPTHGPPLYYQLPPPTQDASPLRPAPLFPLSPTRTHSNFPTENLFLSPPRAQAAHRFNPTVQAVICGPRHDTLTLPQPTVHRGHRPPTWSSLCVTPHRRLGCHAPYHRLGLPPGYMRSLLDTSSHFWQKESKYRTRASPVARTLLGRSNDDLSASDSPGQFALTSFAFHPERCDAHF